MLLLPWLLLLLLVVCCSERKIKNIQINFWKQPKICLLLLRIIKVNTQTQFQMLLDFTDHLDIMMTYVRLQPYSIWQQDKMNLNIKLYNFIKNSKSTLKPNHGMISG